MDARIDNATVDGRTIGQDEPPYIIADMSVNHLGYLDNALKLIEAAKWAGADAIKPQLYTPDELCKPGTIAGPGPWEGQDLYDIYTKYQTPREWFPIMWEHARKVGITIFSSVFSLEGVDYLESIGNPAFKISLNESDWWPLVDKVVDTDKPVFMSVPDLSAKYCRLGVIPLYNRPGYPLPMDNAAMTELYDFRNSRKVYGFSGHAMDSRCMIMAVALGCSIIEAHITLDLRLGGPDTSFSWEPHAFRNMVDDCNAAWRAMRPRPVELPSYRRNLETGLRECSPAA